MALNRIPNPEEVLEAISKFISTPYVEDYFKRRGILFATNSREAFGHFGQNLFLDYDDYVALHDLTTRTSPGLSIAGFEVDLSESDDDPDLTSAIQEWSNKNPGKIEGLTYSNDVLSGKYHYSRRSPGKYELVGSVNSDVKFELYRLGGGKWNLRYFPERVTDKKQFENLVKEAIGTRLEINTPKLSGLPQSKRIEFFDCLLEEESYGGWQIRDVIGLKIKEPDALPEDDDLENDSEAYKELEEKALGSIREAVLRGENLRTNSFVRQFEDKGYYFQSMTFALDDKDHRKTVEIVVRFKLRPIGLEITMSGNEDPDEELPEESALSKPEQKNLLENFWQVTNRLLKQLHKGV